MQGTFFLRHAQADTGSKIINYQIVILDMKLSNFAFQTWKTRIHVCIPLIDAPIFTKYKTESLKPVFHRNTQFNITLRTANQDIAFTIIAQMGNYFAGTADMSIPCSLNCI